MLSITIITAALSVAAISAVALLSRKNMLSSGSSDREKVIKKLRGIESELKSLMRYTNSYVSKAQYKTLCAMLDQAKADLEHEKEALKGIETKLDSAQENVEKKESQQQEVKSSKEEDEEKLDELLASYSNLSEESISLEQKLASSLKDLDGMVEELELTEDQKGILDDLNKALTSAGSLLRDLITEHSSVNERLELLKEQHADLEDEYTKLVEQQLGE